MNSIIDYKPKLRRKKRKTTLRNETQQTIKMLIITLTVMIVVLAVLFLRLTNQSAQKGYALEQAKLQNEYLLEINENLSTKITDSTAFSQLEEKNELEGMEGAETVEYVTKEDNSI